MTKRLPCPPAPGPLEAYAAQFDDRLETLAQRRGLRDYLQGLLLPRDRHKTLPVKGRRIWEVPKASNYRISTLPSPYAIPLR